MKIKAMVHKFKDDVNTDEIIPARYLSTIDPKELARHCMEDIDTDFVKKVKPGDIIVAGKNFGCGSSREHAPLSIKAAQISCVVAESFARIFFRNAINIGLPIVESPEASKAAHSGDEIEIDVDAGWIKNITRNQIYKVKRFPPFMQELVKAGGLMNWVKKNISKR